MKPRFILLHRSGCWWLGCYSYDDMNMVIRYFGMTPIWVYIRGFPCVPNIAC